MTRTGRDVLRMASGLAAGAVVTSMSTFGLPRFCPKRRLCAADPARGCRGGRH